MARTRNLIAVALTVFTVAGTRFPLCAVAHGQGASFARVVRIVPGEARHERTDLSLLRATGSDLVDRSATFAAMIESLSTVRGLMLYMRPAVLDGLLGRGRYEIDRERLIGIIEVNPYRFEPQLRVRAIAHEIAHAYEIGCLARGGEASGVREVLNRRRTNDRRSPDIETGFAQAVEIAVQREFFNRSPERSRLAELSVAHGVGPCVTDLLFATAAAQ